MSDFNEDALTSSWSALHFGFGFLSYMITRIIIDQNLEKNKNLSTSENNQKKLELVFVFFFVFCLIHTFWEIFETHKICHVLFNKFFKAPHEYPYNGDSLGNSFVDTMFYISGFWLGYLLIGV